MWPVEEYTEAIEEIKILRDQVVEREKRIDAFAYCTRGLFKLIIGRRVAGGYRVELPWRKQGYAGGSEFMGSYFFEDYECARLAVLELTEELGKEIQ